MHYKVNDNGVIKGCKYDSKDKGCEEGDEYTGPQEVQDPPQQ
tara:strand:+ start:1020 stop:1145 length:126 start_codon:yes stop_codon:yes gene_type:complete